MNRKTIKKLCSTVLKAAILWWSTVFVRISAHPPPPMSDIEEAAPDYSLIDLSDNEIEIEIE